MDVSGDLHACIDNDLYNDLEFHKKLRLVSQGVRVTVDELPPSNPHLTNIDIVSLIVFLNILMDDTARFLKFLFRGESTPKTKNFDKLKNFKIVKPRILEFEPFIRRYYKCVRSV